MVHSITIQETREVIVVEDNPNGDERTPRSHTTTMQYPREVVIIDEPLEAVIQHPVPLVVATAGELLFNRGMNLSPTLGELMFNKAMFSDGHDNDVGVDTSGAHVLQGYIDYRYYWG
jgi:hypothetical protein